MISIFVTGDLHIGKKYDRYPAVKEQLIESRFRCLARMVRMAETEQCALFIMTGDCFDNVSSIKTAYVERVVEILSGFAGTVLVLPGNHDYYTEEVKLWKDFRAAMEQHDHNILLLNRFEPLALEIGEEQVCIYPAFCQSKHAQANNLAWIRQASLNPQCYNIGVAHGALAGITPDMNGEYFLMTETELLQLPVDVWAVGHTHIAYPPVQLLEASQGHRVYNAGTPEQLDLHNNTAGYAFVISLEKRDAQVEIHAKACHTGAVSYHDRTLQLSPQSCLEEDLEKAVQGLGAQDILRLRLSGVVSPEAYAARHEVYRKVLGQLLSYEVVDAELSEQITREQIRAEFPEIGFAAAVLEQLLDDPVEAQMAYTLLQECRE